MKLTLNPVVSAKQAIGSWRCSMQMSRSSERVNSCMCGVSSRCPKLDINCTRWTCAGDTLSRSLMLFSHRSPLLASVLFQLYQNIEFIVIWHQHTFPERMRLNSHLTNRFRQIYATLLYMNMLFAAHLRNVVKP